MVCLDLTQMDEVIIRYARFICESFKDIERVFFVHNIKFEFPDSEKDILKDLDKPLVELIADVIEEKIEDNFKSKDIQIDKEVIIQEDNSTPHALNEVAQDNDVDLVITGKKISYKGTGEVTEKLLGMADFNSFLLMVPETTYRQIDEIVVPTDFSKASKKAIQLGVMVQQQTGANLQCQHVFNIPAHYFPYIPVDNMEERLRKDAKKEWATFAKTLHQIGASHLDCAFIFNDGKNTAQTIYDYALQKGKDLIVISTKGKGAITSFLIGSVAIRLIRLDMQIPLMITR